MRAAPVARRRVPRPSRLTRLVALVAALGQLLVAVAAWADAAVDRAGDARPHVESDCALCAAQHVIAAPPSNHGAVPAQPAVHWANQTLASAPAVVAGGAHLSRAPPTAT